VAALRAKKLFAVGLDVTTPEPLDKNHPLYSFENVIIVPHIASATLESRGAMADIAAENCIRAIKGEKMISEVTKF
jgi:phosphoglycerate dehydrogenase-like enzyme